jgi:HSP20 family molecular chaperone IbpA
MKFYMAASTALPVLVSSSFNGFRYYGRPNTFVSHGRFQEEGSSCDPRRSWLAQQQQQQKEWNDRALFEQLESEFNNGTPNPRRSRVQRREDVANNRYDAEDEALRQQQQDYLRKQQEWVNRAFGVATEVATDFASSSSSGRDVKEAKNQAAQQQQEWLNQAFGLATDVAWGVSSPHHEANDGKDAFQVAFDVPSVKASDIDISFNEDDSVLKVSGKRDIGEGGVTHRIVKFSKSFSLDSSVVDKENISAQINNGVLLVTAPKVPLEPKENKVRRFPVVEVGPENFPVQGPARSAASDKPSPQSKSSPI